MVILLCKLFIFQKKKLIKCMFVIKICQYMHYKTKLMKYAIFLKKFQNMQLHMQICKYAKIRGLVIDQSYIYIHIQYNCLVMTRPRIFAYLHGHGCICNCIFWNFFKKIAYLPTWFYSVYIDIF